MSDEGHVYVFREASPLLGRTHALVQFSSTEAYRSYVAHLGEGGMFLSTDVPEPVGSLLRFQLQLSESQEVKGFGEVVWVRFKGSGSDKAAGMGVQFRHLEGDGRNDLMLFLFEELPRREAGLEGSAAVTPPPSAGAAGAHGVPSGSVEMALEKILDETGTAGQDADRGELAGLDLPALEDLPAQADLPAVEDPGVSRTESGPLGARSPGWVGQGLGAQGFGARGGAPARPSPSQPDLPEAGPLPRPSQTPEQVGWQEGLPSVDLDESILPSLDDSTLGVGPPSMPPSTGRPLDEATAGKAIDPGFQASPASATRPDPLPEAATPPGAPEMPRAAASPPPPVFETPTQPPLGEAFEPPPPVLEKPPPPSPLPIQPVSGEAQAPALPVPQPPVVPAAPVERSSSPSETGLSGTAGYGSAAASGGLRRFLPAVFIVLLAVAAWLAYRALAPEETKPVAQVAESGSEAVASAAEPPAADPAAPERIPIEPQELGADGGEADPERTTMPSASATETDPGPAQPSPAAQVSPPSPAEVDPRTVRIDRPTAVGGASGLPPLTGVQAILWQGQERVTEVTVVGNGAILPSAVEINRLDGDSPRQVVKISGVQAAFDPAQIEVRDRQVVRVRTGLHSTGAGALHVVLDLTDSTVYLVSAEVEGNRLKLRFRSFRS